MVEGVQGGAFRPGWPTGPCRFDAYELSHLPFGI
jgi:hypothetical protein